MPETARRQIGSWWGISRLAQGMCSSPLSDPVILAFLFCPWTLCDFILSSGNSHVGSIWAVEMFAGELQDLESVLSVENLLTLTRLYDLWAALKIRSIFQVP